MKTPTRFLLPFSAPLVLAVALGCTGGNRNARPNAEWITYTSEKGGFSVSMPSKPEASETPATAKHLASITIKCTEPDAMFFATCFDPPPQSITPERVVATLKNDRDASLRDIKGKLKKEQVISIRWQGKDWPGLLSEFESARDFFDTRVYAVDGRVYTLQVATRKGEERPGDSIRFFESFKLADVRKAP